MNRAGSWCREGVSEVRGDESPAPQEIVKERNRLTVQCSNAEPRKKIEEQIRRFDEKLIQLLFSVLVSVITTIIVLRASGVVS